MLIGVIYRPPPSSANKLTFTTFMSEFSEFMAEAALTKGQLLIVGDFNIHIDSDSSESEQFKAMFDTYSLSQNVTTPTHNRGHILDLVLTRSNADMMRTISVTDQALSNHSSITFTLHTSRTPRPVKMVSFCSFKSLDKDALSWPSFFFTVHAFISVPCRSLGELQQGYDRFIGQTCAF